MRSARSISSLYLCYFPLTEPLVQTQVLPYLRGLVAAGHEIHLLTYEVRRHARGEKARMKQELAASGINWHSLRYHKAPSLPATAFDVIAGVFVGAFLVRRHDIDLLHARTHVPGAMALGIRRLAPAGLLFDIRGLMAEEYVDAGTWKEGSLPFRLVKRMERRCLEVADGVVVLTEKARERLFGDRQTTDAGAPVVTIPSAVNVPAIESLLDRREEIRKQLGIEECIVMIYVGKFSTWYMAQEMAAFFRHAIENDETTRFLILTQSDPTIITSELSQLGLDPSTYRTTFVDPALVGAYLGAADFGISFIKASPSKIASSPTKIGEYLAAGLPVIVSAGVGDSDELLERSQTGVVVARHDASSYQSCFQEIRGLLEDPSTHDRCKKVARDHLSLQEVGIPRYVQLFEQIALRLETRNAARLDT